MQTHRNFLIVGLGNPGSEYADTRHNVGFQVVDQLARRWELTWEDKRYGWITETRFRGRKVVLLKPSTFMNLSGRAVLHWLGKHKMSPAQLLVVTDDIHLDPGVIRLRAKGSDGGHNGLLSIQEILGSTQYPRLRFGVGRDFPPGRQADYVLDPWPMDQQEIVSAAVEKAVQAVETYLLEGMQAAMNRYNG